MTTFQTLIWTTLPAGIRRIDGRQWRARISVFVSPRLDVPMGASQTLAAFPAWEDWPATLRQATPQGVGFRVQVEDGRHPPTASLVLPLAGDNPQGPDSTAWRRLFPATTPVRAPDASNGPLKGKPRPALQSYPAGGVLQAVRSVYSEALVGQLAGRAFRPSLSAFAGRPGPLKTRDADGRDSASPIEKFIRFHRASDKPLKHRAERPEECPDFHRIAASFGSHPLLMRKLGLVVDLEVPADELGLAPSRGQLRMRVLPEGLDGDSYGHFCPWTAVECDTAAGQTFRVFTAAREDRRAYGGFHALGGETTAIAQENLEQAAFGLIQYAQVEREEEAPLPALLQGGMRLTRAETADALQEAMADQARLERSLADRQRDRKTGVLQAASDEPLLHAEQLTRGYRIDVRDVDAGLWRSLCGRKIRYHCEAWSWPSGDVQLEDEGLIEPVAHVDHKAEQRELRATDDLFDWDGWSLVVPRPDQAAHQDRPTSERCQGHPPAPLTTDIDVPHGSLQPQRFGRCYQFRARAVDLAGNSLTVAEADAVAPALSPEDIASDPVCCLRVESAKPPVLLRATPRGPGEAGDVIVVREAEDLRYRTIEARVHVLPPEVPLRLAEKHGLFDGMPAEDSWRLIRAHRGKLAFETAADTQPQADDYDRPVIREPASSPEIKVPYVPDPLVRQAVLVLPDSAGSIAMPAFDDLPRASRGHVLARSCRLVVRAGGKRLKTRRAGRQVVLEVPRGRVHTIRLAARLAADEIAAMALAHPDWQPRTLTAHRSSDLVDELAAATGRGEAPLLAPSRTVRIVHATQRPLVDPQFGRPLILPRAPDTTTAMLADDALAFDRPSTGRIDVYARWEDPVDDPASDAWGRVQNELYAGGVAIDEDDGKPLDPVAVDTPGRSPLSHDFGDTKHHEVTYEVVATSRFTGFYPEALTGNADNVTRRSRPVTLHVPSTAPPAPPDIAYVVPTLQRNDGAAEAAGGSEERHAAQIGDGLRVYLHRGWFSSGPGERLALVVAVPGAADPPENRVSAWGLNPLHNSAPLPGPLQREHVWGGAERIDAWPLEEGTVGLVLYDVQFGAAQGLPFADITFLSQQAFMPFVRLALARYQAHAIDGCRLSRIVPADFVPLAPGRSLTVTPIGQGRWHLTLRGASYRDSGDRTSRVQAHIEVMEAAAPATTALWQPIEPAVTLSAERVEDWRFHWSGAVQIDDPELLSSRWRRRVVIQEFEPFAHDGARDLPLAERSRLVSAHTVPI